MSVFFSINSGIAIKKIQTLVSLGILMLSFINYIDSLDKLHKLMKYFVYSGSLQVFILFLLPILQA